MAALPTHLLPTTVVGSYPQPDWLVDRAMLSKVVPRVRMTGMWRIGQPFLVPPGTPPDRVKILRDAMRKAFADPEYIKGYEKLTSEPAMPLAPEEFEKQLRELPREPELIDLFKKFSGPGPLPKR